VRFATPALASPVTVRNAILQVEPNLVVVSRNLQKWIDLVTEQLWNMVTLIVILGLVATVLAASGIYGAVSLRRESADARPRHPHGSGRFADGDRARSLLDGREAGYCAALAMGAWISAAMAASLRENLKGSILRIDSSDPLIYGSAMALWP